MKTFKNVMSWVLPIIVGLLIAMVIRHFVFSMVRVDGPSMEPNLENNERVAVVKTAKVKRLSVVVFNAYHVDPDATSANVKYVKRVIGMPGDTVSSKNGQLYVNGKKISQNFISQYERTQGTGNWNLWSLSNKYSWHVKTTKVPKHDYFVLGDHRSVSNDGRYWGFVPQKKVIGVVKVPFWDTDATKRHNVNALGQ
ncbi:signal peptidase I [Lactiplantibacillus mudanjiangensis]|uniref:Signal peptidase I n=1 Tax=Lactiplantibacillus mudanjiangensis TaxID=1296538 RepID=A0A660E1Z5_9LACO|nr:signal peptidase I [Lactiplantibacillus mudanjiangensis]VDG20900.1 signal peptidase I [Lactobacillus sp.] [Lactiplantibacillus mudanjiangensis]VDG22631.1 signal peptidase I [Lactobacillus sp.] [Lactiplantibacillus mudanjiangensis]VDG26828.1 signal peptidase I [Lactobacillus sp.] [Lactiplantibacillus mudanjiangensis]VDG31970.1 signal peptidase I [Lactobacillus sp.] [Lactiplantibacillus mudanjiangensis]